MKVSVIPSYRNQKEFTVEIQQGHQLFRLDYSATKKECQFMAKMFRIALKNFLLEEGVKPVTRTRRKKTPVVELESAAS
jgi:hypothetical protein